MTNIYSFTVDQSHLRLDQYLVNQLPDYSRSKIQNYIKKGHVTINGKIGKPSLILQGNEIVECHFEPKTVDSFIIPEQMSLDILYEDDTTLTVNNDEEMREAKGNCDPHCFDLVYPVTFIMPDDSIITVTSDEEEGWEELKDWYEENPDTGERPNFQYPINIIYEDGTTGTINNEDELDAIKGNCE